MPFTSKELIYMPNLNIGDTILRKNWDNHPIHKFCEKFRRHQRENVGAILVMADYRCLGIYDPEQQILFNGFSVCVWHPNNSTVSISETIETEKEIQEAIERLEQKVLNECIHSNAKETYSNRYGLHEYYCEDCGEHFSLDSSD